MLITLTNRTIFTGSEHITRKTILIENGIIKAIMGRDPLSENADIIDYLDNFIAPGLIDLQIAGG
jgi:N-acetylglucosamine-6-phosphate deacetylase